MRGGDCGICGSVGSIVRPMALVGGCLTGFSTVSLIWYASVSLHGGVGRLVSIANPKYMAAAPVEGCFTARH